MTLPQCLRMADRALLTGYPRIVVSKMLLTIKFTNEIYSYDYRLVAEMKGMHWNLVIVVIVIVIVTV